MKSLLLFITLLLLFFSGCTPKFEQLSLSKKESLKLKPLRFDELPQWDTADFTRSFESFQKACNIRYTPDILKESCHAINTDTDPKKFFESYFTPFLWVSGDDDQHGLVTGYYEPQLEGSLVKNEEYHVPLLKRPKDLLHINMGDLYPELKGRVLRGRLKGNTVVPYYTREEIVKQERSDDVLCWVKDKVDLFFLQVQGSGRILLDDNRTLFVGYGDKNGHPYNSIGNYMLKKGYMKYHEMSLQGIKAWAEKHPDLIDEVLNHNESYLFFSQNRTPAKGAMGVVLTPEHSLAVDTRYIPLGLPIFITTNHPLENAPFSRLAIAQDRGAAIKGKQRVDFFWGFGKMAAQCAGRTKSQGSLVLLLPNTVLDNIN